MDAEGRVQDILDEIPLTPPWTIAEFMRWLSDRVGRTIVLDPWRQQVPIASRCGALWVMDHRMVIKYNPNRSPRGQRQEIMHEAGHVLLDHQGSTDFEVSESLLTEGLDPEWVRQILHRGSFDDVAEAQAEWLGTHLAGLSRGGPNDTNGAAHRAASLFELMRR
ncbi:ImmA/IrrE family metallo-endopeptidase (plasmid) [Nocardia sp. NBC_01377]|uniref:ImmA/IrrE family metallo-endopeptidase n=1 Tax=Nocardia sp. NBC_01377 TaxID=2903595 RepID=UPI002F90B165